MNLHDTVILNKDFNGIKPIKKGTHGTVVFLSNTSRFVMVEFFDEKHNTISVETLLKTYVS